MLRPSRMAVKDTIVVQANRGGAKSQTRRAPLAVAAFLGAVFLLKAAVVFQLKNNPLLQPDAGLDTTAYVELARKVLAGDLGLGPGLYYVSPLYIYFLAAGLAVFDSFTAVRMVQVALGTASVWFIFLMAREWFSVRAGWIAAVLAALTGLFTFYEALILQASIDAFLTALGLLALTFGLKRHPRFFLLAGLVFGIQTLNRPNMLLAAAGLAVALLLTRRPRPAALLAAGLVAGLAPSIVRNVVVAGEWSIVSSHGGLNFYIGNSDTATGFYHQVAGITPTIGGQELDARRVATQAAGHPVTAGEASDYFFGLAWRWIREHPASAGALFLRKLAYTFNAQHIALPQSYPFYAYDTPTLLRFLVIGPWLLVPLGVVGLAAGFFRPGGERRTRSAYLVWVCFVPAYAAGVAVFFVAERYRLPLLVPLSVAAGGAVDAAVAVVAAGRVASLLVPAVALAILAGLSNWPLGLHDGRWEEGLRLAQRLVILGRFDEAEQWVPWLDAHAPRAGAADYGLGMQLLVSNQNARALAHLSKAQQVDPANPAIDYALGQALLREGRAREAVPHLRRGFEGGIAIPEGGYDLAVALHDAGDFAGAAEVIGRIRPADAEDPEAWLRLGRLAAQVRAPGLAADLFRRAVALRPAQASAHQQLGLDLLVLERFDEAARELAEAVRLDPSDPDSLSHLAYCELKLGRPADAKAHAEAALALNPNDALAVQLKRALAVAR